MGSCCDNNAENISMVEKNITTNLINVQNNLQANQTGLQEQINENKTEYIENKYVCGLNTHFHTKSPLVTSHHDSYSNAIKLENNMLLTAAHNVTEVQLRNPIQGLELGATLPDNSVHDVSGFGTDRGSTGDSSTVVITDKITGQKREILCNQYRYGTAFYDITKVKFNEYTMNDIESYIATGEPYTKSGGFGLQSLGASLIRGIDGDYYNVEGFPVGKFGMILSMMIDKGAAGAAAGAAAASGDSNMDLEIARKWWNDEKIRQESEKSENR